MNKPFACNTGVSYKTALPEDKWELIEQFLGYLIECKRQQGKSFDISLSFSLYYEHLHGKKQRSSQEGKAQTKEHIAKKAESKRRTHRTKEGMYG